MTFTPCGKDKLFRMTITRKIATTEHFLNHLPLLGIYDFGLGDDTLEIPRDIYPTSENKTSK